ncbi:MAG: thioesterase family protein [Flavobacteriales bacterium]|nr:acyl-CoA thioesterase [Flavobacteriales bacterium]
MNGPAPAGPDKDRYLGRTTMKNDPFVERVALRWADLDVNGHVRHTVYYDLGSRMRMKVFADSGLTMQDMRDDHCGPVLFREECRFLREVHLDDPIDIHLELLGMSRDHRKFRFQHRFLRGDELCATIQVDGAWMDTRTRKIFVPSQRVRDAMDALPKAEGFDWL